MNELLMYDYLESSARKYPEHTAIEEPGKGNIAYGKLNTLTTELRDTLKGLGVLPGDRVGLFMHKSIDAIASMFGIMRAGAAHVPVDPLAPVERGAYILSNCSVKVILTEKAFETRLREETSKLGCNPLFIILEGTGGGTGLRKALSQVNTASPGGRDERVQPDGLAYILYTSGSTGKPKGVSISHSNGSAFVNWCIQVFRPEHSDRFSSHAPLHFDLSIFDIYVTFGCGGTLVIIGEDVGKDPTKLAALIGERRLTVWYSAPSILTYLVQYGHLERQDTSTIRLLLFAGEVFPVKHLNALKNLIPKPRYFNLYGPTETNVCTYHEIPQLIEPDRTEPFPIGRVCEHLKSLVVEEDGHAVPRGEKGELCIHGANVMQGYWNLPEQNARCFFDVAGRRWYRTGDIVIEGEDGVFILVGRRDRMVKRRGYRVELGEIEAGLYRHPVVKEAAVVALPDPEMGVRIRAFMSFQDDKRPSIIEMKQFCMQVLPPYMIPDQFSFKATLPKTSTDKIDYQTLKAAE